MRVWEEWRLGDLGVDGGAELGAAEGGAGLEDEGEDVGVERESKGGLYVVEESEGFVMAALVDVGSQLLGEREQALEM